MGVKLLAKRVFEYETVKGDRMAQYVNDELRVRMRAANQDPARLLASRERRALAEAAIEPLLPERTSLRRFDEPRYESLKPMQDQRRLLEIQRGFAYRARDRLKDLDEIIKRNLKSLRFRMAFAFAKLDQVRFQMRLIYSKFRSNGREVYMASTFKWYTLVLKKYIDIVYMVERIYKVYNVYVKFRSQFEDRTAEPKGIFADKAAEGPVKPGSDSPMPPAGPPPPSPNKS